MASPLSTVKIKPEQPKRAFFRKILRRHQSQFLANTRLPTTERLDSGISPSNPKANTGEEFDASSCTCIDSGLLIYNHERDTNDIMLNPDADVFSSSEELGIHEKLSNTPLSPLFQENENFVDESVWANLTYESLEQPKYFKPLRKGKKCPKLLNNIFLAQELRCSVPEVPDSDSLSEFDRRFSNEAKNHLASMNPKEILVMEFSRDGKYLAAAGRDTRITVWQVISSPLSKLEFRTQEAAHKPKTKARSKLKLFQLAPVFLQEPIRVFEGHSNTVLCLDWSKNNFLASGSMDKTVKLWNVDRAECLETLQHTDFVTSVKFHPNDDRFLVTGALDDSVRLWSILEASVAFSKSFGDNVLITALAFTPLGDHCIVGAFDGSLFVLETQGLRLAYRVDVKERSVHNPFHSRDDRKITGIMVFENPLATDKLDSDLGKYNILVTTNDSNIRLIDLNLNNLMTRFKGIHNDGRSVVASLSDDSNFVISGSEDHYFYVWRNDHSVINNKIRASLKEIYEDNRDTFAQKQDKLAKLIPNVHGWKKLLSPDDGHGKHFISNENNSYASIHAHHENCTVAVFAPQSTKRLLEFSDDLIYDLVRRKNLMSSTSKLDAAQQQELSRGDIIVTCDSTGLIRVFRQDCAYYARKSIKNTLKLIKREEKTDMSDANSSRLTRANCFADISKGISTRSSSPNQDLGASLKMKLQSKLNAVSSRNSSSTHQACSFSTDQKLGGLKSPDSRNSTSLGAISGSTKYVNRQQNGRTSSISASKYTRGRAESLLSASTALSSTESLVIRNNQR